MQSARDVRCWRALVALCIAGALCAPRAAGAGGLRCSIGEVVIGALKIGQTYSLQDLANLPLMITNTGEQPVQIRVDPMVPDSSELRQGARAIPAPTWASARPDTFTLGPQGSRAVELRLSIPDDEALFGQKYQVIFWSHTMAQAGDLLAYGLKSRVIFSVDTVRAGGPPPAGELAIDLSPDQITLARVVPGRAYSLEHLTGGPLRIRNNSSRTLTLVLAVQAPPRGSGEPGQEPTDLLEWADVRLEPTRLSLQPGEERRIGGTVTVRKGAARAAKSFQCVVSASVVDLPVETQIQSRLLVRLK